MEIFENNRNEDVLKDLLGDDNEGYPKDGGNKWIYSAIEVIEYLSLFVICEDHKHCYYRIEE